MAIGRGVLAPSERRELERRARSRTLEAEDCQRAKLILLLAKGYSFSQICRRLDCTDRYISVWKKGFQQGRLSGLDSRYRGSQRRVRTAETEAKILAATRKGPTDGTTHWSSYRLAKHLSISPASVYRVWRQYGIQPHRLRRYMASNDPEFEEKAADIIGLYLKPPIHAAVFCVDEKSAIQALDRLDPRLPLPPGRAERHGFEYYRHGTLSLYAALDTRTGEVLGKTSPRHTSTEFVEFLDQILTSQPPGREIHLIADNLSAHKTKQVSAFSQLIPTSASTIPQPIPPGSTKLKTGSLKFSAKSSRAAYFTPSTIWLASSCVSSATIIEPLLPSAGLSQMKNIGYHPLYESQN